MYGYPIVPGEYDNVPDSHGCKHSTALKYCSICNP